LEIGEATAFDDWAPDWEIERGAQIDGLNYENGLDYISWWQDQEHFTKNHEYMPPTRNKQDQIRTWMEFRSTK